MSWQSVIPVLVRNLIGDIADTPKYSDSRIEQSIVTAGLIVSQEFPFDVEYEFDFVTPDITPDPTEPTTLDNVAIALFSLKAACILSINNYQAAVRTSIRVRDGDSEVDTTGGFKGYSDILTLGPCAAYNKLLASLSVKMGQNQGRAVLSPFSSGNSVYGPTHFGNLRADIFYNSWSRW